MGWEKYTLYTDYLLASPSLDSGGMPYRNLVFALAGLGILLTLIHRVRLGYFLALTVMAFAWIFRFFPQYRLWNARLLPFYYLALYLLAGLALGAGHPVGRDRASRSGGTDGRSRSWVGAFGAGVVAVAGARRALRALSAGCRAARRAPIPRTRSARSTAGAASTSRRRSCTTGRRGTTPGSRARTPTPSSPGSWTRWPQVADEHGCGRAMWEYEGDLQRYGTPMALMLLPYFTDGCVGSMEGLYFESSTDHAVPLPEPVRAVDRAVPRAARPALQRLRHRTRASRTCR